MTVALATSPAAAATNYSDFIERGLDKTDLALFVCAWPRPGRGASTQQKDSKMKEDKEQHIEVEGLVTVVLPGTMFRVELDNKHTVLATICGKMRKRWVRLTAGDRVKMEMSPYDLNKARITWRLR